MYQIKDSITVYNFHLPDVLDISPMLSVHDEIIKKQKYCFRITLRLTIIKLFFYDKKAAHYEFERIKTDVKKLSLGVINE